MKNVKTFDQLLDEKYGKKGNTEREISLMRILSLLDLALC